MTTSVIVFLSGCTSLQTVSLADDPSIVSKIRAGDSITVFLKDGTQSSFVVEDVDSTSISGAARTVQISDIQSVELRQVDSGKTMGAVGVGIVITVLLGAALADGFEDGLEDVFRR